MWPSPLRGNWREVLKTCSDFELLCCPLGPRVNVPKPLEVSQFWLVRLAPVSPILCILSLPGLFR